MYFTTSRPACVVIRPLVFERCDTRPSIEKPFNVKPLLVKPFVVKPLTAKPFAVKPFMAKPLVVKPFAVKPFEVKPLMVKPFKANPFSDSTAALSALTSSICSAQPTIPTMAPKESPTVNPSLIVRLVEAFIPLSPFSVAQPTPGVPLALRRPIARVLLLSQGFELPTCKNQSSNQANAFLSMTNDNSGT